MINKLKDAEDRFVSIENELAMPETVSDQQKYKNLMREYKQLTPIIEKYREYKSTSEEMDGALQLSQDPSCDAEMRELARTEYEEL